MEGLVDRVLLLHLYHYAQGILLFGHRKKLRTNHAIHRDIFQERDDRQVEHRLFTFFFEQEYDSLRVHVEDSERYTNGIAEVVVLECIHCLFGFFR